MDPFDVLGVPPGAPPDELAAAYRRAAKRWHPDRGGGEDAQRRMAEINAAYDLLRDGGWRTAMAEAAATERRHAADAPKRPQPKGAWLSEDVRRALGGELIAALRDDEKVLVITPTATWASPSTLLVLTDQRLVWLLDDAIGQRVQNVPVKEIADVSVARGRLRRDVASLRLRTTRGRRHSFAELRPETAQDLVRRMTQMRQGV